MKNPIRYSALIMILFVVFSFTVFAEGETDTETTAPVTEPTTESVDSTQSTTKSNSSSKSSNTNLSALTVSGKTQSGETVSVSLEPQFSATTRTYSLSVPFEVVSLSITATAADSKAKISIPESYLSLDVGNNKSFVYVTAENGAKRTYQINTTRNEQVETTTVPVSETTTIEATQAAATTMIDAIDLPAGVDTEKSTMNNDTKLGIIFASGAVVLLAISGVLFVKTRNREDN